MSDVCTLEVVGVNVEISSHEMASIIIKLLACSLATRITGIVASLPHEIDKPGKG